jgi:hypothetical protein
MMIFYTEMFARCRFLYYLCNVKSNINANLETKMERNNTSNIDIRTSFEKERDKLYGRIVSYYAKLKDENPDAAPSRLFAVTADKFGMTAMGIRKLLIRLDVYRPVTA